MIGKTYLGDGVYVTVDNRGLVLTAENGLAVTDTIVLGGQEWQALEQFVARVFLEAANGPGDSVEEHNL